MKIGIYDEFMQKTPDLYSLVGMVMNTFMDLMPLLLAGSVAGFIAGLLGVGGGIVTIPVLFLVFEGIDVPFEWRMHAAIGTSLAIIIATNCSSAWAHHKKGAVEWGIVKKWSVFIAGGAVAGSYFATYLKTTELVYFFATLAAFIAVKMLLPLDKLKLGESLPAGIFQYLNPTIIGFFSSVMGIGGGSFSVPYMTLYNVPIRHAVATATVVGLTLSFAGALGYVAAGQGVGGMPFGMIGFIHLPSAVAVSLTAVFTAPLGARAAHKIPQKILSIFFGLFLVVATLRLISSV